MPTAENAKIMLELGQELNDYELMTNSGDEIHYTASEEVWSGKSGFEPIVRPNGLVTGGAVTPAAAGGNNNVDVAGLTCYLAGVLTTVAAAANTACSRGADANICRINSITITAAGAVDVVEGTAHTAFSETRGANGGPPYIAVDSIEIAQVRFGATAAAAVDDDEIYDVVGQHCERYDYPVWTENNIGDGLACDVPAAEHAHVKFSQTLPTSHTGDLTKRVYIRFYEPQFSELDKTLDFRPVENTHSVTSTQYYNGTVGSKSKAIGQGGFTAMLNTGVSDDLVKNKDEVLTVKFYPDRNKSHYILTQGSIGLTRTFPVAGQIQATCTISAETVSAEFES